MVFHCSVIVARYIASKNTNDGKKSLRAITTGALNDNPPEICPPLTVVVAVFLDIIVLGGRKGSFNSNGD